MSDGSRTTMLIWAVAAVLVTLAAARLFGGGRDEPAPIRIDGGGGRARVAAGPASRASRASQGTQVYVHVAGEVRRPGLYRLPDQARVAVALERAGGPARRAELSGVNLAAKVVDGQQIVVPKVGAAPPAGASAGAAPGQGDPGAGGVKLSLASAGVEQLEELDGIGPTLAERIVEYRDAHGGFRSLEELNEVEGIGEKRFASLRKAVSP